jgi:hypothetical protein
MTILGVATRIERCWGRGRDYRRDSPSKSARRMRLFQVSHSASLIDHLACAPRGGETVAETLSDEKQQVEGVLEQHL